MYPNKNDNEDPKRKALPTDGNLRAAIGGVLLSDGKTVVPFEIDDPTGALIVKPVGGGSALEKPTNAYAIGAISETATYKYFFFENDAGAWYIMRKNLSTNQFDYAKGASGGYLSVWTSATTAPSGSLTFDSYGNTF